MVESFTTGVFASVIGNLLYAAVLPPSGYVLLTKLQRLQIRRTIWRFADLSSAVICIATSAQTDTGRYLRPATGIGQVRALGLIAPSLSRAYKTIDLPDLLFDSDLGVTDNRIVDRDLIVLGGPKNNQIAKHILETVDGLPVTIKARENMWGIQWQNGTFAHPTYKSGEVTTDYGLILRTRNPFNPKKKLILLAGIHTFGVVAAAYYLVRDLRRWRHLFLGDFVAVVKTQVHGHYSPAPELVQLLRLPPKQTMQV